MSWGVVSLAERCEVRICHPTTAAHITLEHDKGICLSLPEQERMVLGPHLVLKQRNHEPALSSPCEFPFRGHLPCLRMELVGRAHAHNASDTGSQHQHKQVTLTDRFEVGKTLEN